MCEKFAKIVENYDIKIKIMKLPNKIRAFVMELENHTYIIVNESLSEKEQEKAFYTRTFAH